MNDENVIARLETAGTFAQREIARTRSFEFIWNNEIESVFADVAPYYDRANTCATFGLLDHLRGRFLSTVAVNRNERVLDVCAGTNAIGIGLLRREPTLKVDAIDRSRAMQEVGAERARREGLHIESTIHDVHTLPYPDNAFDVVTLQWATRHLRVIEVFSEIRRVLKPGGRFHHCDMLRPASPVVEEAYCAYLTACVATISRAFRSGEAALRCRRYFVDAIRMFYSVEELSQLLRELGYAHVVGKPVLWGTVGFHSARKPLL